MDKAKVNQAKLNTEKFLSECYFSVGAAPSFKLTPSEEHLVRVLSRLAVSICTAWWSLMEVSDYIRNRKTFSRFSKEP